MILTAVVHRTFNHRRHPRRYRLTWLRITLGMIDIFIMITHYVAVYFYRYFYSFIFASKILVISFNDLKISRVIFRFRTEKLPLCFLTEKVVFL